MQPEPDAKELRSAAIGVTVVVGVAVVGLLAFLLPMRNRESHRIRPQAEFKDVHNLKPRANVYIAGIRTGSVESVELDPKRPDAPATVRLTLDLNNIPDDSTVSIMREGILGPTALGIALGHSHTDARDGATLRSSEP